MRSLKMILGFWDVFQGENSEEGVFLKASLFANKEIFTAQR
jgi:hypothetical protein